MRSFKDLSLKTKLNLLVMVAGGVAILFSCGALVLNDYLMMRAAKIEQLSTLADVLGSSTTAALDFDDQREATELLSSLRMQPSIICADIYDANGKVFASYERKGLSQEEMTACRKGQYGYQFTDDGRLTMVQSISRDGEIVGSIHLCASMSELNSQMMHNLNIVAIVMIVSLSGSLLLTGRLQQRISLPLLKLIGTAQQVSASGDYSVRVTKEADDELGTLYDEFNGMLGVIQRGEAELQEAHDELENRVQQRTKQLSRTNVELSREIAERKRAEEQLENMHERLMETARQAGMAEIATGVLHNVGNVLNSVNVSASLIGNRLRTSRVSDLAKASALIEEHADDLAKFFSEDKKGKLLPDFLGMLADHLSQERDGLLEEIHALSDNVDHVKTIVSMQQSFAGVAGVVEIASLESLIEDALRLNQSSFEKHGVRIVREYAEMPEIRVEKQRLLQIVVNLITNAKDALASAPGPDRQLLIRTSVVDGELVRVEVVDNGEGIDEMNLTRIFSHGFTTKQHGHGFGLHSSANAAKEMGGQLTVHSEGPGKGAAFIVEFPFVSAEVETPPLG